MGILANTTMLRFLVLSCFLALAWASPPLVKTREEIDELKVALENSQKDDGLTLEERMAQYNLSNAWAGSGKFQGDMVLDEELIKAIVDEYASGRHAYIRANVRWPHNTLVYEFGAGEFNHDQQRHIINVMNALAGAACVRFRHRNNHDRTWVRITGRPTGCYAAVGYNANSGARALNLARANIGHGCMNFVVVAHELLHSLGFLHMQSTYNRYNYVRIHWNNIQNGMAYNFYKFDNRAVSNLGLPYEYGSCMHYGTHFFSRNGQPTITTTRHYGGVLGQTSRITGWDVWRLARLYNCPGAWSDEAMQKARTTAYVMDDEGTVREEPADIPLADELEMLELQQDEN